VPTRRAFERLLEWLDEGVDSSGRRYLETRARLVRYFQYKRCPNPDELADDTLNRVARRLEEAGDIVDTPPARYCYITAKFVLLEHLRRPDQQPGSRPTTFDHLPDVASSPNEAVRREGLLDCLDRCMRALPQEDAQLILDYYRGEQRAKIEQRRRLATERNLSPNALKIRACRIREKLEACINACRADRERGTFLPFSSQGDD
jgi:DNA-directed RNA polymerase specialized sigma24 family protein